MNEILMGCFCLVLVFFVIPSIRSVKNEIQWIRHFFRYRQWKYLAISVAKVPLRAMPIIFVVSVLLFEFYWK